MSNRPTLKAKRQRSISASKEEASGTRSKTPAERAPPRRILRTVHTAVKVSKAEEEQGEGTAKEVVEAPKQRTPSRGLPEDPSKRMRSLSKNVYNAQRLAKKLIDEEDAGGSEPEEETTRRQDVVTKYKAAGHLVDEVLAEVIALCTPGANTHTLCAFGDSQMLTKVKATFAKTKTDAGAKIARGISYPCNVSVNNVLCNHSPLNEAEGVVLKAGDVVKVHLGCHIDGYPVSAARTFFVPSAVTEVGAAAAEAASSPLCTPSAINAIEATRVGLDSMIHLLRPGVENADVTDYLARVGGHYDVEAVEGVLSTRTKRWIADSMQTIIGRRVTKSDPQQDVAPCTVEAFQVWTLDVAYTNAPTYKMQASDDPINIYRKNEFSVGQDLRSAAAAEFLHEVKTSFHCFPFHSLHASQPVKARLGISVLKKAGLLDSFTALHCKGKQFITARFQATVIVSDKRVNILCGAPPSEAQMRYPVAPTPMAPDMMAVVNEPLVFAARDVTAKAKPAKRARVEKVATAEEAE